MPKETSKPKFMIIDGNAIIHRAYHAIPPMTTKDGLMVNAVYGFTSMLFKAINDVKPAYIAVTFDMAGGSKARLEKFKDYKATRVKADQALYDQIPLTHEMVAALGIPIFEKQGYEADDVIGTLVKNVEKKDNVDVFIVTGDMDTLQLVDDHTKVYTLRKGLSDIVVYDEAEVEQRFGFGPERIIDYKAIRGDTSDNIPGVPGIGEKGATELIQKCGSLDDIYKKIQKLKELGFKDGLIKKLEEGKESAYMSYELSQIDCAVPGLGFKFEDCKLPVFDHDRLLETFRRFEFLSLIKRIPGAGSSAASASVPEKKTARREKKELIFTEIKTSSEIVDFIKIINTNKYVSARAVISGDFFAGSLKGVVLVSDATGIFVPASLVRELENIFADPAIELVGHDLKQCIKALLYHTAIVVKNMLFDIMIASYLLNSGNRATDLASIVLKTLGKELPAGSGQESLFGVDNRLVAHELWYAVMAGEQLKKELQATDNFGLLQKIEMPLETVLGTMELNGVAVDTGKMQDLSDRVTKQIATVSKKIYDHAGQEFNISSPIQLREILFEKLEIPVDGIKKGKTGLSTSAEQLEKMRGLHPIIDEIENYRELTKLDNTYISVLPTLINKKTHRIHTTFNQAVAATGRLSSTDPNLQNIPIRTALGREIRDAFIAEPGNVLISADYSQIELRIVASLAEDKHMMEIFEKNEDIHTATAAAIHGVPIDKVTKDMRRSAKEINFGVLYGMGVYGLSWRADISRFEAKAFIDKYFQEFSGVKQYIDKTIAFAKKEGYCETLFGRRRYIPELSSTNFQLRNAGERMAVNHPVQGTAADLMKMAMISVHDEIKKSGNDKIKMILQVHDELVLEVPEKEAEEWGKRVQKIMTDVVKLRVPIEVHVGTGKHWGEIK